MPVNSASPIIGRLASTGFEFLSSTSGFPVVGLIGSLSQTITPQIPPPHLLTFTLASPAWVSQIPVGSPAAWLARRDGRRNIAARGLAEMLRCCACFAKMRCFTAEEPSIRGSRYITSSHQLRTSSHDLYPSPPALRP